VPIIDQSFLNCAFYLYPSEKAAKEGMSAGGSGFLVGMPAELPAWWHLYAVTNRHVLDGGNHTLRVNTQDGRSGTIQTQPESWTTVSEDDVAVLPLELSQDFEFGFIPVEIFLPEMNQGVKALEIGDDAVLVGRLITHDGKQRNKPIARFGSIAMMADINEPISVGQDQTQVGFLIDCRSLSGASGSAVLGFRVPHRGNLMIVGASAPVLLGIDCAHLPFWTPVCGKRDRRSAVADAWVESNSGIAVVVPAWRILNVLNQEHLVEERCADDEKVRRGASAANRAIVDFEDQKPPPASQ
jgi:hypothetical protein